MQLSTYAQQKFDLLNKHGVFIRREQLEEAITLPDSVKKRGKYYFVSKDTVGAVYQLSGETKRVITFYPIK